MQRRSSIFKAVACFLIVALAIQVSYITVTADSSEITSIRDTEAKSMRLWYNEPAPESSEDYFEVDQTNNRSSSGWLNYSTPMGNGYMGVNWFGGLDQERIQITENSLQDSNSSIGGVNSFAEVFIDFGHTGATNYVRELDLNEGLAGVHYDYNGVTYTREYLTSYPDKVMALKFTASTAGALSFVLDPKIPYLCENRGTEGDNRGKSGSVTAEGDTITLSGVMEYYNLAYEGQFKVIPTGGSMQAINDEEGGKISVTGADEAIVLIAVGTNYEFDSKAISGSRLNKIGNNEHPHAKVSGYIADAAAKSYDQLKASHQADYKELFGRVNFDLGNGIPDIPTDQLVKNYQQGTYDQYLEELTFQFGRYMLICSSRDNTLPPHLQGIWNVYQDPPWRSGYWHNVNLQMNYWPAFAGNLPELFESYIDYFGTYLPAAQTGATTNVRNNNSSMLDADGNNGWALGNSTWPYSYSTTSSHSGWGTGAWTAELFWDYYDYTRDEDLLRDTVYPVLSGQSNYLSRMVKDYDGTLLISPSYSPENQHGGGSYKSIGTTFDQQQIYENHVNTLKAAEALGLNVETDEVLSRLENQLDKLDPIVVGKSGQIKEYREEEYYGDIGEYTHRHISQLLGAYPGQLIGPSTPAWVDATKVSLTERGRGGTGWAKAERVATWARTGDGDSAYYHLQDWLKLCVMYNLFNNHRASLTSKLFQVDGNFGATAAVTEMLVQSSDYVIEPLPAIPDDWQDGSYSGLLARGNFEISASWAEGSATQIEIQSNKGGECEVRYDGLASATLWKLSSGAAVEFQQVDGDQVKFDTVAGETYVFTDIPAQETVAPASNLSISYNSPTSLNLSWTASADADHYEVYRAIESAADYELIGAAEDTAFSYESADLADVGQCTFRVVAVSQSGRQSDGVTALMLQPKKVETVSGSMLDDTTLQVWLDPVDEAESYNFYKRVGDEYQLVFSSPYTTVIIENASEEDEYFVAAYSGRESAMTPIPITSSIDLENVCLNKSITGSGLSVNGSYPLSNAVDGNATTRFATQNASTGTEATFTVEIDLDAFYSLGTLSIYEFRASSETGTRSGKTTVKVYDGSEWQTVINEQSLDTSGTGNGSSGPGNQTDFNLNGIVGSKISITFVNTGAGSTTVNTGQTIHEITCTGSITSPTDKKALFQAVRQADTIDTSGVAEDNPDLIDFLNAKASAVDVLQNATASQQVVDSETEDLLAAIDWFIESMSRPERLKDVFGVMLDDTTLQIWFQKADYAKSYNVYKKVLDEYELVLNSPYSTIVIPDAAEGEEYAVSVVTEDNESFRTAVIMMGAGETSNVFLNKPVTASKNPYSASYPFYNGFDGSESTRFATADGTTPVELQLTIDLEGVYVLGEMQLYEYLASSDNNITRSNETTVEVYLNGSWKTVINKQPCASTSARRTTFDMGGAVASQVRITMVNTGTAKGQTFYEISCIGSAASGTDKAELYRIITQADSVDPADFNPVDENLPAFLAAKADAVAVLEDNDADQDAVDSAAEALQAAMDALLADPEPDTIYQEYEGDIRYTGSSWKNVDHMLFSAKRAKQASKVGDSLSFTFKGDAFSLVSYTSAAQGIVEISVDGDPAARVNLYDSTYDAGFGYTMYSSGRLPYGEHMVTVTVVDRDVRATGYSFYLDCIKVSGELVPFQPVLKDAAVSIQSSTAATLLSIPAAISIDAAPAFGYIDEDKLAAGQLVYQPTEFAASDSVTYRVGAETATITINREPVMRYEDDFAGFVKSAGWTSYSVSAYSGGTALRSATQNSTISFTFEGTGFDIISYKSFTRGTFRVEVKNSGGTTVVNKEVDCWDVSADTLFWNPVYKSGVLEKDIYDVTITVLQNRNVEFDAVDIIH